MSAWRIYGPDGHPMVVAGGDGQIERTGAAAAAQAVTKASPMSREEVDRLWASEVQKRVRSRAVSLSQVQDRDRGKQKPTPVTYNTLRLMAQRSEWCRAAINTRKRQVAGVPWSIQVKDEDRSGAAAKAAKSITKLLTRPSLHGSAPDKTHWQQFIGMFLEDLLALDRAVIEKERDGQGWIVAMYNVDGATVRPNMDDRGFFEDDAFIQVVDGELSAKFGVEDLIVGIYNPQTDVRLRGYGMSPVEHLVVSITADLHASRFNADYFEKGSVPEGILDLGEDVAPEDVDAFRIYWLNEIMGRPWSLPIIGGAKAPQFISWRESNRDMQFMEYQDWLLQKICAVFEMSKDELGAIEDVNRSTAEVQDTQQDRKGIQPLLDFIKQTIDLEVIGEYGQGLGDYLEFEWEQTGESADAINKKFQPMVDSGAATHGEWREAHGMDPDGDERATHGKEGLRMHLSSGDRKPLPSKQDADLQGTAAEQAREDDQLEQTNAREDLVADRDHQRAQEADAGGASPTPWKPADPDDPDVRQAMDDHDRKSGIGPRNVNKTHDHDHHPALTGHEDDLSAVFERATDRLARELADAIRNG